MNSEVAAKIIERWGFPVLVACAAGWILRNDVLRPLVQEHQAFVRDLSDTQRETSKAVSEISATMREQTRILEQINNTRTRTVMEIE